MHSTVEEQECRYMKNYEEEVGKSGDWVQTQTTGFSNLFINMFCFEDK